MATNSFRVRRRFDGQSISGLANFPAPLGLFVTAHPTIANTLMKASNTKGFCLTRDIMAQADVEAALITNAVFPHGAPIIQPQIIGGAASASRCLEIEVEGADLLLLSGTGAISSGTAAGTELSTNLGRLAVKQSGQEVAAILRKQLTPLDSTNVCRIQADVIAN
jgi:hypothetical protein